MWRRSLVMDTKCKVLRETVPSSRCVGSMSSFPDPAIFVTACRIQLEPARLEDVARATMLRTPQVEDAPPIRTCRGYFKRDGESLSCYWGWFRPLLAFYTTTICSRPAAEDRRVVI
jgi:hypothetical protein